jgi:hypothetical protein
MSNHSEYCAFTPSIYHPILSNLSQCIAFNIFVLKTMEIARLPLVESIPLDLALSNRQNFFPGYKA